MVLRLGLATGALLTLSGLLAPFFPPLELANHFRVWLVLGCVALIVLQIATPAWRLWIWILLLTGLNVSLLLFSLQGQAEATASPPRGALRIASLNVWGKNSRLDDVAAYLVGTGADVVALQELPARNAKRLVPLLQETYPHFHICGRCRNLAIFSEAALDQHRRGICE